MSVFDWRRLAPDRCYLCGKEGAKAGNREHFVPRSFFEHKKLPPLGAEPLPAHAECNSSTTKDEERVGIVWATVRPLDLGSEERYARALRAVKHVKAAGLRNSFLHNMRKLPIGGEVRIPGHSVHYVIAKMVRGIIYRATGHVYGPCVRWYIRMTALDMMVAEEGEIVEVPGVLTAKFVVDPDDQDTSMCFVAMYGLHFFAAFTFPEGTGALGTDEAIGANAVPLNWPRRPD
jgi:hypothetical protein